MDKFSRRSALKRLGALAGGVGVGSSVLAASGPAAGAAVTTNNNVPSLPSVPVPTTSTFNLFARGLRSVGPAATVAGQQGALRGVIAEAADGPEVGNVISLVTVVATPSRFRSEITAMAVQTFVLPSGTLVGTGTFDEQGQGHFAITGGTGAYHGARGSYVSHEVADTFGGGTAIYHVTLLSKEG